MLFLSFLSPVAHGFISSSRLSPRLWSQSLSFERKHQSSKQWPKRPRSRSPLEVVSIYIASFRCKLHCPCRITRTTTYLSSFLDVLAGDSIQTPKRSRRSGSHQVDADELQNHASITTGVPSFTISNNSITSALRILTQP
jgi:hypothetical protein